MHKVCRALVLDDPPAGSSSIGWATAAGRPPGAYNRPPVGLT